MKRTPLKRKTGIRAMRPTLRRGEPTPAEKQQARIDCWTRAHGRCESCSAPTPLNFGHLHHEHSKRRFGWMESESQRHIWLCPMCHHLTHQGGKPCPKRPSL